MGFNPDLALLLVIKTKTLPWTLKRIQSTTHDDNRGYAAEVLSILLQNNRDNRLDFGKNDGIEAVLKVLSVSEFNSHIFEANKFLVALQAARSYKRR